MDQSVRLEESDRAGIQRLNQYFLRCPFCQAGMIEVIGAGKVLCKSGDHRLGRFPEAASDDPLADPKCNFQIFDPLDFLLEVTQDIPETGDHLIRCYGWYLNKKRGRRAQAQPRNPKGNAAPRRTPSAREACERWSALIKEVYEADPSTCPQCRSEMRIIAFIERRQTEVVEKLRCAEAHVLRVGD